MSDNILHAAQIDAMPGEPSRVSGRVKGEPSSVSCLVTAGITRPLTRLGSPAAAPFWPACRTIKQLYCPRLA